MDHQRNNREVLFFFSFHLYGDLWRSPTRCLLLIFTGMMGRGMSGFGNIASICCLLARGPMSARVERGGQSFHPKRLMGISALLLIKSVLKLTHISALSKCTLDVPAGYSLPPSTEFLDLINHLICMDPVSQLLLDLHIKESE